MGEYDDIETVNYLIVGFKGDPLEVGFEEGKSRPSEVYFDYLGIDVYGQLYVQRSEYPLFKLLHPEHDDDEFYESTRIGMINDKDFYGVLNGETLTSGEIYSAFTDHANLNSEDGRPYILSTFVTKAEFLDFSHDIFNECYKLSKSGLLRRNNRTFLLGYIKTKKMKDRLGENNDEMNYVYMIMPEESPIVDQVFEIHQKTPQQQARS